MTFVFARSAQCDGKARFANGARAHRVVARWEKQGRHAEAYRCVHCGGWHLGEPIIPVRKSPK